MIMTSEISQRMLGVVSPQPKGEVGRVAQVEQTQAVEPSKTVQGNADSTVSSREAGLSTTAGKQNLEGMVKDLNDVVQIVQRQLQFSLDEESGKTLVKVIDSETDEVIRQVPAEEILRMQQHLGEMNGLLFTTEA